MILSVKNIVLFFENITIFGKYRDIFSWKYFKISWYFENITIFIVIFSLIYIMIFSLENIRYISWYDIYHWYISLIFSCEPCLAASKAIIVSVPTTNRTAANQQNVHFASFISHCFLRMRIDSLVLCVYLCACVRPTVCITIIIIYCYAEAAQKYSNQWKYIVHKTYRLLHTNT